MPRITEDDKSPAVRIAIWYTATLSLFALITRFTAKANRNSSLRLKTFTWDDWLVLLALLFSIAQSVAVDFEVHSALGRPLRVVSPQHLLNFERATYAADILYIFTLALAKLSAVTLIRDVTPKPGQKRTAMGIGALIILWAFTAFFAVGFQCNEPRPYDFVKGKCFDHQAWWSYFEAMNIATDASLIVLPGWIIWRTQSTIRHKLNVSMPFSLRFSAIAACITKLVVWSKERDSSEPFQGLWKIAICNSVIQCLEIVPVCFIYLKQFLNSMDSEVFGVDDLARRGEIAALRSSVGDEYLKDKRGPLKSKAAQDAYQRLRGENGSISVSRTRAQSHHAQVAGPFLVHPAGGARAPETDVSAFRGRKTEHEREREIPQDRIEMRREVTIEEAPWTPGKRSMDMGGPAA